MQKSKVNKRCLKHHPQLNQDINDSKIEIDASFDEKAYASEMRVQKKSNKFDNSSNRSVSRNKSFHTNYEQGMYSTITKEFPFKTKLISNNQMFYKRVKMFNRQREKVKFDKIRNGHNNSRGSIKDTKSLKFIS